jgi:hypothetical protein
MRIYLKKSVFALFANISLGRKVDMNVL